MSASIDCKILLPSLYISHAGPYCAVSYDSTTFNDLHCYMHMIGADLDRVDPEIFLRSGPDNGRRYINLTTSMPLRKSVSEYLDQTDTERFSFYASEVPESADISAGVFIYPGVAIYPSTTVEKDVIIHANSLIAHKAVIEQGCFISGLVGISGSTRVGKYCWLGLGTMLAERLSIASGTTTYIRSTVVNDIVQENTVYKKHR